MPLYSVRPGYHEFARGYASGDRKGPAHIAWVLERQAVDLGWVAGRFLGSERELMGRFGANRDVVREALRMLEARGSILIERGRHGGLHLAAPSIEWSAGAIAMFLRASGYTHFQLSEALSIIQPLLTQYEDDHLLVELQNRTLELVAATTAPTPPLKGISLRIAMGLVQHYSPIPINGIRLGSEERLCERFGCSRPTFRQALRILNDLGCLEIKRGRGGGCLLKRPTSLGVVRRMFALLASHRQTLSDILPMKWTLDIVKLRLAMRKLERLDLSSRALHLRSLALILTYPSEPHRWCLLHQALGRIGQDPWVNTLLWCLVAYHVRIGNAPPAWGEIESELHDAEDAMIGAIGAGSAALAELHLRRGQALVTQMFCQSA